MALTIVGLVGGRLGGHRLAVLAEGDDGRQQAAVAGEALLVELDDVGVDRLDVLGQPLALGLEAARGVERPDDQGPPLLEPAEDLVGDPVDGPLDAADVLGAVALDRDGLAEHRRRRARPGSVARWTSSVASSTGAAAFRSLGADAGRRSAARVTVIVARFGANEPGGRRQRGGSAVWSRSWKSTFVRGSSTDVSTAAAASNRRSASWWTAKPTVPRPSDERQVRPPRSPAIAGTSMSSRPPSHCESLG